MAYSQQRNARSNRPVKTIDVTAEDLIDIFNAQKGKCYWSGFDLNEEYNDISHHPLAISPDRLDNDGPYTKSNLVLCYRMHNLGRSTMPVDDFRRLMDDIELQYKKKYAIRYATYALFALALGALLLL